MASGEKKEFNQIKYISDYNNAHYERIYLRVPKGEKAVIQDAAKQAGQSLNDFILRCVRDKVDARTEQ